MIRLPFTVYPEDEMDKLLEIVNNNAKDLTYNKGSLSKFIGINEDLLSYT